jgi:hypothetical protein
MRKCRELLHDSRIVLDSVQLPAQPPRDECCDVLGRHGGDLVTTLKPRDSLQHPPMRLDAVLLGLPRNLLPCVHYAKDLGEVQGASSFGHGRLVPLLELVSLGVDERIADRPRHRRGEQHRTRTRPGGIG